jgi:hypothetical protein
MARFGDYNVTDYSALATLVERDQNLLEELGFFDASQAKMLQGTTWAEFERKTQTKTDIQSRARGADRNYAGQDNSRKEMFPVPFFPLDAKITPADVLNFRMIGTESSNETIENKVRERVGHIQRSHAELVRKAMYKALVSNSTYQPIDAGGTDGPDVRNFSTVWGAARKQVPNTTFDLSVATTNPFDTIEAEGRKHIITNAGDNASGYQILMITNPDDFTDIVNHPLVRAAYASYKSEQEPLRNRLGGDSNNRIFRHGGVSLVEDFSGDIAANKSYLLPLGIPITGMAYAAADTVEHVDQVAQEVYMFMKADHRSETIESETSLVCHIHRPELIVEFTSTSA